MTKNQDRLINLSVHESSDLNVIDPSQTEDIARDTHESDANDDVTVSESPDNLDEPNVANKQITIANLSAG